MTLFYEVMARYLPHLPKTDSKDLLLQAVADSAGNSMDITVRRDGQEIEEQIIPVKNVAGEYKIGIWV